MAEDEAIESAVSEWAETFRGARGWTGANSSDERLAHEALAMFWSGSGLMDHLPWSVFHLLIEATEVGYMLALHEVRDGKHDSDLDIQRD